MTVRHVALCALALILGLAPTVLAGGMEVTENGAPILGRSGARRCTHFHVGRRRRSAARRLAHGSGVSSRPCSQITAAVQLDSAS